MANSYKYYDVRNLTGLNIYQVNNRAQTIYHDYFTKKNYVLDNYSVIAFSNWRLRLPLSILIAGIMVLLNVDFTIAIAVAIVLYILSTIFFYKKFLPQLKEVANFKIPVYKTFMHAIAARYTRIKLIQALATSLAVSLIVFIGVFSSGRYSNVSKNVAIIIIILGIVFAGFIYILVHLKFTDPQLIEEEENRYKYMKARNDRK